MTSAVTTSLPPPRVLIGIRLIVGAGILAGAAVDASHAASMAILAGIRPDRRKLALTNAAYATLFASSGVYATRCRPSIQPACCGQQ